MERIAHALFEHGTVQKAAAALGMSRATVWRWKRKPEFQEICGEVWREALSPPSSKLLQGSPVAIATLIKVMVDPSTPAAVRVRAADYHLGHAAKFFALVEGQGQREKTDATNPTMPSVIIIPPVIPAKEDEIQIMATPEQVRHPGRSSR
jgi:hypothetical protein